MRNIECTVQYVMWDYANIYIYIYYIYKMYTYVQSPRVQEHSEQGGNLAVHVHAILPNNAYAQFPSLPMPEKKNLCS